MSIGEKIANIRVNKNIESKKIAKLLNISNKEYNMIENNMRSISIRKLNQLSNFYRVSLDYIFGLTNNPQNDNTRDTIDYRYLSFSLAFFRKKQHLTQRFIAKLFHVSPATVGKYERYSYNINPLYLYSYAKYFNISKVLGKLFVS